MGQGGKRTFHCHLSWNQLGLSGLKEYKLLIHVLVYQNSLKCLVLKMHPSPTVPQAFVESFIVLTAIGFKPMVSAAVLTGPSAQTMWGN